MVVFWGVEELSIVRVSLRVILRLDYVEVGDPAQLSKNVTALGDHRAVGHPGSFDLVFDVGVCYALRRVCDLLGHPVGLVKVFLKKRYTKEYLP